MCHFSLQEYTRAGLTPEMLYCIVLFFFPPSLPPWVILRYVIGLQRGLLGIYFHVQISQKSPRIKILTRCQFCLLTILSKTRHATQNSVYLIFSLSQGSVAKNIHRRTSTCHTFCLLRSLLPNTVTSSDAISSSNSPYFLRLMRFPILVDMHGNLHDRLARAVQSKDSTYP